MNQLSKITLLILSIALLSGCASTKYDWGTYESDLYRYYKTSTTEDRQSLENELAEIFARTEQNGAVPPPGLYAEYGTFQFLAGDYPTAIQYYQKEKEAWPESSKLMDSMIAKLRQRIELEKDREAEVENDA